MEFLLQWWSRKNHVKFPGVLILGLLKFPRGVTQFCGVSGGKGFFCRKFPGVKYKILAAFSNKHVVNQQHPPPPPPPPPFTRPFLSQFLFFLNFLVCCWCYPTCDVPSITSSCGCLIFQETFYHCLLSKICSYAVHSYLQDFQLANYSLWRMKTLL